MISFILGGVIVLAVALGVTTFGRLLDRRRDFQAHLLASMTGLLLALTIMLAVV